MMTIRSKRTIRLVSAALATIVLGVAAFAVAAGPELPGDKCSPQIANNAAAGSVCEPVCSKLGLKFAGNWSNDANHPPVKACIAKKTGEAVCGCAAVPGDKCSPQIANNAAAAGVCGQLCKKYGLKFAGNWSNDTNHPPVKKCISDNAGKAVCGCGQP